MRSVKSVIWALLVVLALAGTGLADLSEGLIAYYPFDDPGGIGIDASGTGNNGSPVGGVTPISGVIGGGVHLDGTGYIAVPDSPSLDLGGGSGTISTFVKVAQSSDDVGLVSKESNSSLIGAIAYEFLLRGYGTYPTFAISDGSTIEGGTPTPQPNLKDGQWHHIAVTWNGLGGQILMYLDGVEVLQRAQTISTINNISAPVYIGVYRWQGGYRYGTADLDEVRIYERALEPGEIAALAGVAIEASVDLDPDTLNLDSKGKWVTCYIELPEECDVTEIDIDSVLLEGLLEVQQCDIQDGVLMVKFDRADLADYLYFLGVVPPVEVELVVTGNLMDGTPFEGSDAIRVIDEGGGE